MNRYFFAGLCTLVAGLGSAGPADAQCLRCFGGSPFGCGILCAGMFPCSFKHGPLFNYGDGSGMNYGVYGATCGAGGCGHGHDGLGHGGKWGPWNRSAGCGDGCGHGRGGLGLFDGHRRGCDSCGSGGGHYARQTFANVFGRLHPTAHKCGQDCGLSCGEASDACGHGRAWGCRLGHRDKGCDDGCGHGLGGRLGHLGCGGGLGLGGLLHRDGCGAGGCGLRGLLGRHGDGCGAGGCGGDHSCTGLFGIRANIGCADGCGHKGGHCIGGGYGGANYGGYGVQAAGLNTGPWYLYWPTPNNLFQVPGPNAAGWAGNHFVLPAPYGAYAGGYGGYGGYGAGGVNPYFPAAAQIPAPPAGPAVKPVK